MSNLPEVCNLCEHADVESPGRPFCAHPAREKQGIVLSLAPPLWCPLRGETKPAEPDRFRIVMSRSGRVRKVMLGDADVSDSVRSATVHLTSSRCAHDATIVIVGFTLEFSDE